MNLCLQRIHAGWPLRVVLHADRMDLLDRNTFQPLGRIPLDEHPGNRLGEGYLATLEVAHKGDLLPASVLQRKPLSDWLEDPGVQRRLLLDQGLDGEPVFEPVHLEAPIAIEPRPVLYDDVGTSVWKLALGLPCHSIRIYQIQADGHWLMTEEILKGERPTEIPSLKEDGRVEDRYSRMVEAIPSHPRTRPRSSPGYSNNPLNGDWWEFSLDLRGPEQAAHQHGTAMIQERRKQDEPSGRQSWGWQSVWQFSDRWNQPEL